MNTKTTKNNIKKARSLPKGRQVDPQAREQIRELLQDLSRDKSLLIEYLHKIQDNYHHISAKHLVALAAEMKLSKAEVFEVATFYHHFDVIKENETPPPALTVRVCDSITCEMNGAKQLIESLKKTLGEDVRVQAVPCIGRCDTAPVAVVGTHVIDHAKSETVVAAVKANDITPKKPANTTFNDYVENGGYQTYQACINQTISVDSVLDTMDKSGLRGLGGAGFPAGRKWRILRDHPKPKLMAINIDEGEPGTFKDRFYLERGPHRFIEGALIAAWACEIDEIYIYLRDEYAAIRQMLEQELETLNNHPPADNMPSLYLRRGAGAYICGEESAMIESIEGKRGMPRLRPPFVAEVGLFGKPTLEHNMETLHWVRDIVEQGSHVFTDHGRNGRVGLRSFSVSGRVNKPGVHLAPAGITLNELIDEYCDGMQQGHKLYGYFPGGASGGMLPASLANVALDFDTLQQYGCFIGSAAIIVFSDKDKAKDLALNTMRFFKHESCGQCTPCRVGCEKASILMEKQHWDVDLLTELSEVMIDASICGLGQAAPNPLLSVIKYFPQELENE